MIRLSDIVGASGLAGYAVIALLLFVAAFILVLLNVYAPSRRAAHNRAALLPFDEGVVSPSSPTTQVIVPEGTAQ